MDLSIAEEAGVRFLEGPAQARLLGGPEDARLIVEACLSARTLAVLLYASNLTERFFDLSSGEAGAILQTLRNYRIRLAVVCPPGSVRFSSRFGDMVAEERRRGELGVFEAVQPARAWLSVR